VRELEELSETYRATLERELARPVPEAERVLRRSKLLGEQGKFTQAKIIYQDSLKVRTAAREDRRRACHADFRKCELAAKLRHEREIEALAQKQSLALAELDMSVSDHQALVSTRLHVNELRCMTESSWRALSSLSTRRARSVQLSRPQSRVAPRGPV
jgi:predicted component of type VI protein secretion system